jgi:hypothetical protein
MKILKTTSIIMNSMENSVLVSLYYEHVQNYHVTFWLSHCTSEIQLNSLQNS